MSFQKTRPLKSSCLQNLYNALITHERKNCVTSALSLVHAQQLHPKLNSPQSIARKICPSAPSPGVDSPWGRVQPGFSKRVCIAACGGQLLPAHLASLAHSSKYAARLLLGRGATPRLPNPRHSVGHSFSRNMGSTFLALCPRGPTIRNQKNNSKNKRTNNHHNSAIATEAFCINR